MKKNLYLTMSLDTDASLPMEAVSVFADDCRMTLFDHKSVSFFRWLCRSMNVDDCVNLQIFVPRSGNKMTFYVFFDDAEKNDTLIDGIDRRNVWSKIRVFIRTYCKTKTDVPDVLRMLHLYMSAAQCSHFSFNLP